MNGIFEIIKGAITDVVKGAKIIRGMTGKKTPGKALTETDKKALTSFIICVGVICLLGIMFLKIAFIIMPDKEGVEAIEKPSINTKIIKKEPVPAPTPPREKGSIQAEVASPMREAGEVDFSNKKRLDDSGKKDSVQENKETISSPVKNNKQVKSILHKEETTTTIEKPVEVGCKGFKGNPVTTQEAIECAKYHLETASAKINIGELDSGFTYCMRSCGLYENGSNFAVKAKILYMMGKYPQALEAADLSVHRKDHWSHTDKLMASQIKVSSLKAMVAKYPSTDLQRRYEKAQAEDVILRSQTK